MPEAAPPPLPGTSVTAVRKHPCPECGGDAEWNAAKQALACPYCGTVLPWSPGQDTEGETVREHDLAAALLEAGGDQRGWRFERKQVICQSCRAITVFDTDRAAQRCDFCGSPAIVPHDAIRDAITPQALIPFQLSEPQVRDRLRAWYASRWFAPGRFKHAALTDTLHGVYVPYWTFDAHATAEWTAMAGYHYYVQVQRRDAQGRLHTVQEQRTRWEPATGTVERFFDDDLVPGTAGVAPALLRQVEPFPTTSEALKPYDPAYVRGWTAERYQIDLRQASETSQGQMDAILRQLCAQAVPGDTHKDLEVTARYEDRTFKHLLVPVWVVGYTFGRKTFQIIVNDCTGGIAGQRPISWTKVFFYIILPALVLLALLLATHR